ncbi:MAG: DNA repair protein RadC [Holosporales bacterium]|jgi:DNA repair protein RadC|nr:DNA repair protein RadC [Holosporales bacterium]
MPLHYSGHRDRLRKRFRQSNGKALDDYEVLELFLFFVIPYKDTKPIAKELLKTFRTFENIVLSDESRLCEITGVGPLTSLALKVLGEMTIRQSKQKVANVSILNSWDAVIEYCRLNDAYNQNESVHVLFLNNRNYLIADEILFTGTIDQTPFYIRNIIKRALDLHATSLILVHNHPSGDATPSAKDIDATRQLFMAAKIMDIKLHDHFIITKNQYTSLKNLGIID